MTMNRRQLLNTGAASGAGLLAGAALLQSPAEARSGRGERTRAGRPFGPLESSPGDLLALPAGFSYEVVAVSGETDLVDGDGKVIGKTPERPDGTFVVRGDSGYRMIQNHEGSPGSSQPVPLMDGTVYDPGALGGGCTVIDVTGRGRRRSETVGLSGTVSNCAGGPTPWGSWLTCEESEAKAGTGSLEKDHGYVFEVFASGPQLPEPIKAWGRAPHEAVVVEPGRQRVYLTEDASKPTGLLYRWTAPAGTRLRSHIARQLGPNAGTLEALAVVGPDGGVLPDLAYVTSAQIGRPFATRWVTVPDRHATDTPLRSQFDAGQVTHSKKLEGAWGDEEGMYFVASFAFAAGDLPADATPHDGQLWHYRYADRTLTLVAYFPYNAMLHSESRRPGDGSGPQPRPRLRRAGRLPRLAVRIAGALRGRQHRQPPAQLDPRDRGPGDRPEPDRAGAERPGHERLQRDDRAVLQPRRFDPVRQRAGAGPRLRDHGTLAAAPGLTALTRCR